MAKHVFRVTDRVTDRSDTLTHYFREISKYKLLSDDEFLYHYNRYLDTNLSERTRKKHFDTIILSNTKFVISVAKAYSSKTFNILDLINEGNTGLIEALKRYSLDSGFKFISYAIWWIRNKILNYITSNKDINLPNSRANNLLKINNYVNTYYVEHGLEPTDDEILNNVTNLCELDLDIYHKQGDYKLFRYDNALSNDDTNESTFEEFLIDSNEYESQSINENKEYFTQQINELLENVSKERDKVIIKHFYGVCGYELLSYDDIAKKYDMTYERVRQIVTSNIREIRDVIREY